VAGHILGIYKVNETWHCSKVAKHRPSLNLLTSLTLSTPFGV
jgi:hypothetical protein